MREPLLQLRRALRTQPWSKRSLDGRAGRAQHVRDVHETWACRSQRQRSSRDETGTCAVVRKLEARVGLASQREAPAQRRQSWRHLFSVPIVKPSQWVRSAPSPAPSRAGTRCSAPRTLQLQGRRPRRKARNNPAIQGARRQRRQKGDRKRSVRRVSHDLQSGLIALRISSLAGTGAGREIVEPTVREAGGEAGGAEERAAHRGAERARTTRGECMSGCLNACRGLRQRPFKHSGTERAAPERNCAHGCTRLCRPEITTQSERRDPQFGGGRTLKPSTFCTSGDVDGCTDSQSTCTAYPSMTRWFGDRSQTSSSRAAVCGRQKASTASHAVCMREGPRGLVIWECVDFHGLVRIFADLNLKTGVVNRN